MSLAVAVPCGIAAAVAYGAATAVQHSAAHTGTGEADAAGLLRLLRNPRWWLSIGGDSVGLLLQVIALATGPVVLIQPLLVLALPVSLFVGFLLGGPRPGRSDYLACAAIVAGLAVFFVLIGDPGNGDPLRAGPALVTIGVGLLAGALVLLAVRGRRPAVRAVGYGVVAGAFFGMVGVMINAVAETFDDKSWGGFAHADGLVPLLGVLVLGALAMTLTQISFQIGALGASFPANESAAPLVAVLLGALLLHEDVPVSPFHVVAYALCFGAIVFGTIRLANSPSLDHEPTSRTAGPLAAETGRT
jgi:drug/metabolite transporter (DMT)-like permease